MLTQKRPLNCHFEKAVARERELKMRDLLCTFSLHVVVEKCSQGIRRLSLLSVGVVLLQNRPKFFGFLHSFDDSLGSRVAMSSPIIIALLKKHENKNAISKYEKHAH